MFRFMGMGSGLYLEKVGKIKFAFQDREKVRNLCPP
jgi:hypothetical protein